MGASIGIIGLGALVMLRAPAPDVARPEWTRQVERGTPRVDLGVQGGRHVGFHAKGEWQFRRWHHGEFGVGGLFSTHFYFQRDPRAPQEGVPIRGVDSSVNLAPTVGHTFRFARRRLSLATLAYVGMSIRSQHTEVEDELHGFTQRHDFTEVFADLGALASFGVRLGKRLGLNLDGVVPLYVGPVSRGIPLQWSVTGPYAGLSLSYYFF